MSNYKIRVHVEIVECDAPVQKEPVQVPDGAFELNISSKQAESIDDCEQALLQANYPAIRDALAKHLAQVSKKKPKPSPKAAR